MTRLILHRIGLGFLTLFVVSLLIFAGTEILPGDVAAAVLGSEATEATLHAMRVRLGLYDPAYVRYFRWLGGVLTGDFGHSLVSGQPVSVLISGRVFNTLFLAFTAAVITMPLSILFGVMAVVYERSALPKIVNILGLTAISVPEFFVAYLLILLFSVKLGWLPSVAAITPGTEWSFRLTVMVLPVLVMIFHIASHVMRMCVIALKDVMREPYIEMAILKGMTHSHVVIRHSLPNALPPILGVIGTTLATLIVGVVVVEVVFVYPGVGQLLVDAVSVRDVPVVQACSLIFAVTYVVINATADMLAIAVDPRQRYAK